MVPRIGIFWLIALLAYFPLELQAVPSDEVQTLLKDAEHHLALRQPEEALRLFRKASKKGGASCLECILGLARGYRNVGAHKDALEQAQRALDLEPEAGARVLAHSEIGLAHLGLRDKGSPEVAAGHFQEAIDLSEAEKPNLYYNLGISLLRAGRDEEGVAALEKLLRLDPPPNLSIEARSFIDNPRRARENLVPAFSATTLEGRYLSSEDLAGKVVLYDFWATWCGPCHKALPNLRRLNKKMQDTPFVLVSVSSDRDEGTLRAFVDKERMLWPQIHDKNGRVTYEAFKVSNYPTYILVDHEGKVIFRRSGWSPGIDTEVGMQVKRALKKARKSQEASPGGL